MVRAGRRVRVLSGEQRRDVAQAPIEERIFFPQLDGPYIRRAARGRVLRGMVPHEGAAQLPAERFPRSTVLRSTARPPTPGIVMHGIVPKMVDRAWSGQVIQVSARPPQQRTTVLPGCVPRQTPTTRLLHGHVVIDDSAALSTRRRSVIRALWWPRETVVLLDSGELTAHLVIADVLSARVSIVDVLNARIALEDMVTAQTEV
jgi:hypothetical protein